MIISSGLPREILTKKIVKCNESILIAHKFYEFRDFTSPGKQHLRRVVLPAFELLQLIYIFISVGVFLLSLVLSKSVSMRYII